MTVTGDGNVPATPIEEGEQQVEKQEIQKEEDTMYNDEEGEQQVQVQKQEIQEEDMMYNDHHDSGAAAPVNANGRKQKQHVVQRRTGVTAEAAPYDISYRPGRIMLYSPIRQRQKWGDTQVLPRINFSDLFFDLFYVAATYNVSFILVDQVSGKGLLYAMGTFLPVMGMWMDKMFFDSRFVYEDDLFHQLFQICILVVLATAVLHIRSVDVLSHPATHISMFVFCILLVLSKLLLLARSLEIYWFGLGQTQILKMVAIRDTRRVLISGFMYLAAAIVAGIEYCENQGHDSGSARRGLADTVVVEDEIYAGSESSTSSGVNHIPISLCLAGFVFEQIFFAVFIVFFAPAGGRHKESTVPMNVDFVLHRNGEWTMLMLGESVFSILIVDIPNESLEFYKTFYFSLLTIVLMQYLHFRSQPSHADHHAMRRSKNAGISWSLFQNIYSFALVSLGAAFTIFLTVFANEEVDDDAESCLRWLAETDAQAANEIVGYPLCRRWLAAGGEAKYDTDALKERAAHLFSGSLAMIFFCLDCMTILHLGIKESEERCVCKETKKKNSKGMFLLVLRIGLLVFSATLSQWLTEPQDLAGIGVACVLGQLLLRKLGGVYLSPYQLHAEPDQTGEH